MSCKCCGKPADPEERRAKEMYAGPAFHLAPPPKPPAPRRLEHSWQHEWDASDRPPLYEAPKPNAFRPPPPAPRIPPAAAARMAGLDSPTVLAPTRDDDARGGDRADDGAAGATSPAGTADSAEAVRAALGLSPRSPGGRADAAGNPSSPAAFGDVVMAKNTRQANARNAAEWRASLALDPAKARQERQIGDLMASLGLNTRKKRRNLVYPDAFVASAAGTAGDDARESQSQQRMEAAQTRLSYPRAADRRARARARARRRRDGATRRRGRRPAAGATEKTTGTRRESGTPFPTRPTAIPTRRRRARRPSSGRARPTRGRRRPPGSSSRGGRNPTRHRPRARSRSRSLTGRLEPSAPSRPPRFSKPRANP